MKYQVLFSRKKKKNKVSSAAVFGALMLLHSERPKLYTILAFLSAIGLVVKFQYYPFISTTMAISIGTEVF